MNIRIAAALGVLALAVAGATAGPPRARAADTAVTIVDFAFTPSTVTINVGDTVTWTNADPVDHTVTSHEGLFDEYVAAGESASITFEAAGEFAYFCEPHPDMEGTVVVQAAVAPSATGQPQPTPTLIPDVAQGPPARGGGPAPLTLAGMALLVAASLVLVLRLGPRQRS